MRGSTLRSNPAHYRWPRWWRWTLLGLATLVLCSCRSAEPHHAPLGPDIGKMRQGTFTPPGTIEHAADGCAAVASDAALPGQGGWQVGPTGAWRPPGIAGVWPEDEYLHDGGDTGPHVYVDEDWEVYNLEMEDTVAHFDTLDGRRLVEPSNRVDLYAPRFGAVRSVSAPLLNEQVTALEGVERPTGPERVEDLQFAASSKQQQQAVGEVGRKRASGMLMGEGDAIVANTLTPRGFQDRFMPYEDLAIIRRGMIEQADKPMLAIAAQAAVAWNHDAAVQVILDRTAATEYAGDRALQMIYVAEEIPTKPRLRVVKVASKQSAKPGEEVDFTIRFDNVGTAVIGNVTILDNLTTRLEYVPDTAQSSVEAEFFTTPNEGDSLVLRWEIASPLEPGQGGIVRFRCRVR